MGSGIDEVEDGWVLNAKGAGAHEVILSGLERAGVCPDDLLRVEKRVKNLGCAKTCGISERSYRPAFVGN